MKDKLRTKDFATKSEIIKWANSKDGTDYIIAIEFNILDLRWHIFYIG